MSLSRRKKLEQFGLPAQIERPAKSPPPAQTKASETISFNKPPHKVKKCPSFGVPTHLRKTASTPAIEASEPPPSPPVTDTIHQLGNILESYVNAQKLEAILEDLMRDFRENPDAFLSDAAKHFEANTIHVFLNRYTKHYRYHLMTAPEIQHELSHICPSNKALLLIDKIFLIKEWIEAGTSMSQLLAARANSSIKLLMAFTEKYQSLSKDEQQLVSDLVIDSIDRFNPDDLIGILAYASTYCVAGEVIEKFPMKAAAVIATRINEIHAPQTEPTKNPEDKPDLYISLTKLQTHSIFMQAPTPPTFAIVLRQPSLYSLYQPVKKASRPHQGIAERMAPQKSALREHNKSNPKLTIN